MAFMGDIYVRFPRGGTGLKPSHFVPFRPTALSDRTATPSDTFADPGTTETHRPVDWGDGDFSSATVTESGGTGTIAATHAYAAAGVIACGERSSGDETDPLTAEYLRAAPRGGPHALARSNHCIG